MGRDLGAIRHVVCASPAYFRKFGRPKTPQELKNHNCLADPYSGPKKWPFRNSSRPLLIEIKGSMSSTSQSVLIQMALHGSGIVRVPFHLVRSEITQKRLEVIFQKVTLSPERLSVYFAKAKRLPAKTFDFVKFLETSLRSTQDAGR